MRKILKKKSSVSMMPPVIKDSRRASLVAQMITNPPVMQEAWAWSLVQKDTLEEDMAAHCSILTWRIPWTDESLVGCKSMGSQRVGHDWVTNTHTHFKHAVRKVWLVLVDNSQPVQSSTMESSANNPSAYGNLEYNKGRHVKLVEKR